MSSTQTRTVWEELPKDEVGKCKKCKRRIWKYWLERKTIDKPHEEMTLCGPHYFK